MIKKNYVISALMKELALITLCVTVMSFSFKAHATDDGTMRKAIVTNAYTIYDQIDFGKGKKLNEEVFAKAYFGFINLKESGYISKDILSVCDFSLSSNQPRLWVIDLKNKKVIFNTLVAHGQGTGDEFATKFSNTDNSHQSSLGFYVTSDTYTGDNGYSLHLNGLDPGYNDKAYSRAIVMHGADYVSKDFINANQRLGRSWGCPAVPKELSQSIINAVKGGSCLFIYFPDKKYMASSKWLQKTPKSFEGEILKEKYVAMQSPATAKQALSSGNTTVSATPTTTTLQPESAITASHPTPTAPTVKIDKPKNTLNSDGTFSAE